MGRKSERLEAFYAALEGPLFLETASLGVLKYG